MSGCTSNLFQNQLQGRIAYHLKCQFYRTMDPRFSSDFSPGKFTKEGVTTERNKGRNGSTKAFLRMNTSKMKNKPTKSTRRAPSCKKKSKTPPKPTARRNDAHRADSTSSRCKAQLVLILHEASGDIYLGKKSVCSTVITQAKVPPPPIAAKATLPKGCSAMVRRLGAMLRPPRIFE